MTRVIRVDTQASAPSLGKSIFLSGKFDPDKSTDQEELEVLTSLGVE